MKIIILVFFFLILFLFLLISLTLSAFTNVKFSLFKILFSFSSYFFNLIFLSLFLFIISNILSLHRPWTKSLSIVTPWPELTIAFSLSSPFDFRLIFCWVKAILV